MNGDPLYPKGFHPFWISRTPDVLHEAKALRRRDVPQIKYYFVDFGISSWFDDDDDEFDRVAAGMDGRDQDVPELKSRQCYDPFPVDIFIVGNMFKKTFIKVSSLCGVRRH